MRFSLKKMSWPLLMSVYCKCHTTAVQLTARYAGFLEITTPKGQEEATPTSYIRFLHRTARDFLENKERWAKLIAPTLHMTLNPLYAIARALALCVLLEWHLYGEGFNYHVLQEMYLGASDALKYAY